MDWYFEELVSGLVNYREAVHQRGPSLGRPVDLHGPKGQRFNLVANNLNNAVLSNRPGIMAPPRLMLRFDTRF